MNKICVFDGCYRETNAKGLCHAHYRQMRRGIELKPILDRAGFGAWRDVECEVASCNRPAKSRGLCATCYQRLRIFNISREELINLPAHCEACGSEERTHLDHDHETNKVRGVLCHGCNVALGHLKDNKETLNNLIKYLEKHSE